MGRQRQAREWARWVVSTPGIVILDTETTGIGSGDEVIELAVLDAHGRVLLDTLVRATCPIDPGAARVHGLTEAILASAPEWPLVYRELLGILRHSRCAVTYNASFDRRLLEQTCRRHGLPPPQLDWHCAMRRFADYAGRPVVDSWRSYHRLAEALERLGLVHPGAHRAAADAEACRRLVHGMAAGYPLRF